MTSRKLAVALAISVALNLFAVAAGVTAWTTETRAERELEAAREAGRERSAAQILAALTPTAREPVREQLTASAQAARPDFQQAREARRQAIALTREPEFDAQAVGALLARSREAEMRGRMRLETRAVEILGTLGVEDRQALSVILNRHRRNRDQTVATPAPTSSDPAPVAETAPAR